MSLFKQGLRKCYWCKKVLPIINFTRRRKPHEGPIQFQDFKYNCRKCRIFETRRARVVLSEKIDIIKNVPCGDCNQTFPSYVMDFHHRDQKTKVASISKLRSNGRKKHIFDEIKKCDVLCANCHRIRTHNQYSTQWPRAKNVLNDDLKAA